MKNKLIALPLYATRLVSAYCLFYLLTQANVWVDVQSNTMLVLGYRFFILFAPLFLIFLRIHSISPVAFLFTLAGIVCWFFQYYLPGALLIAMGMAIGGYAIKYFAVKTPLGAAGNKIALNAGVIFSGLTISHFPMTQHSALIYLSILMTIVVLTSLITRNINAEEPVAKSNFSLHVFLSKKGIAWALVGLSLGIKMIGIFSILPQFLIKQLGELPHWYGYCISLNAIVVVLFQVLIINKLKNASLGFILALLLLGVFIISFPGLFHAQQLMGALIWSFILSLIECAVTTLDTFAIHDGGLFAKEAFVGVGSAITVFLMRSSFPYSGSVAIGIIGFIALTVVLIVFRQQLRDTL